MVLHGMNIKNVRMIDNGVMNRCFSKRNLFVEILEILTPSDHAFT